jgi:hypothetical protein
VCPVLSRPRTMVSRIITHIPIASIEADTTAPTGPNVVPNEVAYETVKLDEIVSL